MARTITVHWADVATIIIFSSTSLVSGVYFGGSKNVSVSSSFRGQSSATKYFFSEI